jgi:hypothetical protein
VKVEKIDGLVRQHAVNHRLELMAIDNVCVDHHSCVIE